MIQIKNTREIAVIWSVIYFTIIYCKNSINDLYLNCSLLALENVTSEFYSNSVYLVRDNYSDDDFVTALVKWTRFPVIILDRILNSPILHRNIVPIAYFVYSLNYNTFESIFLKLNTSQPNWQPRAKFMVLLQKISPTKDREILENIARILYGVNVFNFVILKSSPNSDFINFYTWLPFSEASRCGTSINIIKINECTGGKFVNDIKLHLEKKTLSKELLRGCTLRVGAFHWPPYTFQNGSTVIPMSQKNILQPKSIKFVNGYHVQTINALSQVYNLKIQYVGIEEGNRWGVLLDNGTWTGGLGSLQDGTADILIGGSLQTSLRFSHFDCSPTYHSIFLKFYLPLPGTSIFICILSRISKYPEKPYFASYVNCFLTLWRVTLGLPANCIPKSKSVRIVFLPWIVYCFHITLVYTSALLGVITTPMIHEYITTIKELSTSSLKILVVPQFIQISKMLDEEMNSVITQKFAALSVNYTEGMERLLRRKDAAIFDPEDHFQIIAKEKLSEVYSLDNGIIRFNPGIYGKKGAIYLKFLDKIQLRVRESGLFSKWQEDMTRAYKYKKHRRVNYENEVLPLTLEELSGSFYILIFGLSLSMLVYCFEIITFKFHSCKQENIRIKSQRSHVYY